VWKSLPLTAFNKRWTRGIFAILGSWDFFIPQNIGKNCLNRLCSNASQLVCTAFGQRGVRLRSWWTCGTVFKMHHEILKFCNRQLSSFQISNFSEYSPWDCTKNCATSNDTHGWNEFVL